MGRVGEISGFPQLISISLADKHGRLLDHPLPHAPEQGLGGVRFQFDETVLILARIDACSRLQKGERLSFFLRNSQPNSPGAILLQSSIDVFQQCAKSYSLGCRDMHRVVVVAQRFALLRRKKVNLVHHSQPRLLVRFEFLKDALDLRILLNRNRTASVRNLQN